MSFLSVHRLRRSVLALLALVTIALAAPSAFARGHVSIGIGLPGLGISYSDYGHRGHGWGGYAQSYSSYGYGGYGGYGYAPRPVYYAAPYYRTSYYRDSYYRPPRVVYYDRGHDSRGYDRHDRRYDDRGRNNRHDRRDRDHSRGGYYDRGR